MENNEIDNDSTFATATVFDSSARCSDTDTENDTETDNKTYCDSGTEGYHGYYHVGWGGRWTPIIEPLQKLYDT